MQSEARGKGLVSIPTLTGWSNTWGGLGLAVEGIMRHLLTAVCIFLFVQTGLPRIEAAGPPPALKALLKSPEGRVRWKAAEALWRREHSATDLVPVYMELLTATDADIRAASAWRLGRLGRDARAAVPVLAAALRDEDLEVRVQ